MQVPEEKYLHFCNWPPLSILTSTIVVVASTGDVGFQGTVLLQQMNKINITEYTQLSLSPSCTHTHTEKKIGNRECRKGFDFFLSFFSSPFKYLLLPSAAVKIIILNNKYIHTFVPNWCISPPPVLLLPLQMVGKGYSTGAPTLPCTVHNKARHKLTSVHRC